MARERSQFFVAQMVTVHGMLFVGLLLMLLLIGSKFKALYKAFGTELPVLTKYVLVVSEAGRAYIILVLLGMAALMFADAVFIWRLERDAPPIWSFLWGVLITGILVVSLLMVLTSFFIPWH